MVRFFFYHSWQDDAVQDMKCFWCLFANYLRLFIVLSGGEDFMSSPQPSAWICKAQEVLGTSVVLPHRWTMCKAHSPLCTPQSSAPECLPTANWVSGQLVKKRQERGLWVCELGDVLVHKLLLWPLLEPRVSSLHIPVERLCIPLLLGGPWLLPLPVWCRFCSEDLTLDTSWLATSRNTLFYQLTMKKDSQCCWLGTLVHHGYSSSPWRESAGVSVA